MSKEDMYDRDSVESCHEHTSESEIECTHRLKDGKSAWRVLLGRCVAQCSICGEENDLNPLCTPQLQVDRTATESEMVECVLIEAITAQVQRDAKFIFELEKRHMSDWTKEELRRYAELTGQAKYLDAGDL